MNANAFELEYTDGANEDHGYMIISWEAVEDPSGGTTGGNETPTPPEDPVPPVTLPVDMMIGATIARVDNESWTSATANFEAMIGAEIECSRRFTDSIPTNWNNVGAFVVDTNKRHRVVSIKGAATVADIVRFLQSIPADGFHTWVAWHHEPENDQKQGMADHTIDWFKRKCAILDEAFDTVNRTDLHKTVIYTSFWERDSSPSTKTSDWFPDGNLGDWWMGLDPYNDDPDDPDDLWDNVQDTVDDWVTAGGGEWFIAETGTKRTGSAGVTWINNNASELASHGCTHFLWFHAPTGENGPWWLPAGVMATAFGNLI